jgi:hypothetical protein
MWAWGAYGYPAHHQASGVVHVDWAKGECTASSTWRDIPGYILMAYPLLALPITLVFRTAFLGHFFLQRRLARITELPALVQAMTLWIIPTVQNLKTGELAMILAYLTLHVGLLAYWVSELYGQPGWLDGKWIHRGGVRR